AVKSNSGSVFIPSQNLGPISNLGSVITNTINQVQDTLVPSSGAVVNNSSNSTDALPATVHICKIILDPSVKGFVTDGAHLNTSFAIKIGKDSDSYKTLKVETPINLNVDITGDDIPDVACKRFTGIKPGTYRYSHEF